MTQHPGHRLGKGELTARRVGRDALGMLRQSFWRVAIAALVLFATPAVLTALLQQSVAGSESVSGVGIPIALAALAVAVVLRLFGPVMFAGFLDRRSARSTCSASTSAFATSSASCPGSICS